MAPSDLLQDHNLIVCVGSGGVGKTTVAAMMGVEAANQGRRVLVLTIDPAKRLANALGLQRFGNAEAQIPLDGASGELWAMMLDTRTTMDGVVRRVAPDQETRERIFRNNIYRNISDSFASNQEYMATEQLYDVVSSGRYDLVVLDTPPVKNALDFLDAPGRLATFLDRKIMKWFLTPYDEGRVFGRLLMGTSAVVYRLIGYIFGREFLEDLSDFFLAFRDLYDGFRERQMAVLDLFSASDTAFVVVGAPTLPSVEVVEYFLDALEERGLPSKAVLMNRVHRAHTEALDPEDHLRALVDGHQAGDRLLARLGQAHRRLSELAQLEETLIARAKARAGALRALWILPRLEHDVHDVAGLQALARSLFED